VAARCLILLLAIQCVSGHAYSQAPAVTKPRIDYATQIRPLLEQHCLRCHGPMKMDGDLRVDQREALVRGGDSKKNLLSLPLDENELMIRLRSLEPGFRMPLDKPPLDAASIALVETWIEQGGMFPTIQKGPVELRSPWQHWSDSVIERYEAWHGPTLKPAALVLLGVMVLILLHERARESQKKAAAAGRTGRRWVAWIGNQSRAWQLVGVLLVCGFGGVLFTRSKLRELDEEQLRFVNLQKQVMPQSAGVIPRIRPRHPPRMSGEYYRGNDERNPALFNGGYYRTCTFRVSLWDEMDHPLQWGDVLPEHARIHLEIEKSPFATATLFTGEMMGAVGLSGLEPTKLPGDAGASLSPLKPTEREFTWAVDFPLELPAGKPVHEGMLYLYKDANLTEGMLRGDCHYAVGYKLIVEDGKLAIPSEVWMESVMNTISIHWTPDGKITPAEWFDAVPIPEIINGNSSDPKLLGVEEHLEKLKEKNGSEKAPQKTDKADDSK
jgi:hypothetical protein